MTTANLISRDKKWANLVKLFSVRYKFTSMSMMIWVLKMSKITQSIKKETNMKLQTTDQYQTSAQYPKILKG